MSACVCAVFNGTLYWLVGGQRWAVVKMLLIGGWEQVWWSDLAFHWYVDCWTPVHLSWPPLPTTVVGALARGWAWHSPLDSMFVECGEQCHCWLMWGSCLNLIEPWASTSTHLALQTQTQLLHCMQQVLQASVALLSFFLYLFQLMSCPYTCSSTSYAQTPLPPPPSIILYDY